MDVLMPQLGETVAEGTVANWHKQVGDRVEADEVLLDVETDKVSMEIPAPGAGRISEIRVEAGQTVDVGTVLAVIETAEDARGAHGSAASAAAEAPSPPDSVAGSVETSTAYSAAPGSADLAARDPGNASAAWPHEPAQASAAPGAAPRQEHLKLSPVVRRLLAEHDLDVAAIAGTGRSGRVTRRDVLSHLEHGAAPAAAPTAPASLERSDASQRTNVAPFPARAGVATPAPRGGEERFEPFNRVRRLTAEHMLRSKATSPHVLQAVEVDFSAVERVRHEARERWRTAHGYSLTYLPFIAHAVCQALSEFPHLNSSVEGEGLRLHANVNLAIAVDLGPAGLVAPVIRSAERLSLATLAESMHEVAERAREHQLKPDDFADGTYTLSNSGTFGTLITAPIINQPQVAILSIDGVRKRPVVIEQEDGDALAIRPVGVLAQSFDHRAVDGAYSAAFLARLRALLEGSDWQAEL